MRTLSSLTNRIFLACALLATLSLGFTLYFVNARVADEAEAELRRGLAEAGTLVDQHRATVTDTFTRMARLLADLPKLKAAVETDHPPTVQPLADDYRDDVNAGLLVITGRTGMVLATSGLDAASLPALVRTPGSLEEISTFWPHSRGVLQVISVPILIGVPTTEVLGRLTVGFFFDDTLAKQFKDITGSEITFGAAGRVLASTLPGESRPRLAGVLQARGMSTIRLGEEEFIALSRPLAHVAGTEPPVVLILRSRTDRLRFLTAIRNGLVGGLVGTVLLATIVSYAVARTMTRPLAAITHAMRDIAATGDLTRKVTLQSRSWDDEDARLLASTFNTLTDSIARFQREAAQKERLSSLGRLSTVIAHEIRNPLMIIRTTLRSLSRDEVTAGELREAVSDIDEETSRLNRIVTEVLDFARPIRFEFADTHINETCRVSAQAASADGARSVITLDLDPSNPCVVTDAERLRTALVNLLTNAIHAVESAAAARPTGTDRAVQVAVATEPAVRLRTRVEGGRVSITVSDRGAGIAPDDLARVFDPYFTTRRTGTGLGLPIARNIVDGLGGTIAVASRLGEGTEIRIELPMAPPLASTSARAGA